MENVQNAVNQQWMDLLKTVVTILQFVVRNVNGLLAMEVVN